VEPPPSDPPPEDPPADPPPEDPPTDPSATGVIWSELVNATVNGSVLTKSAGCDGCPDASAASQREISSGDGYFEFTVNETQNLRFVGLSVSQAGTTAAQTDFGLAVQSGYVEVREDGVYRTDTTINSGDVFRISVQSGEVTYARNGTVFYTSSSAPSFPLRSYATLFDSGSSISHAQLASGSTTEPPPEEDPPPPPDDEPPSPPPPVGDVTPAPVRWSRRVNTVVSGTVLRKSGGCDGCADSNAQSRTRIDSGDGYLEFTVNETDNLRYVGLLSKKRNVSAAAIDFAVRLQGGYAEVRENGAYRTETPINSGDVFRITVHGGQVTYTRNGTTIYSSSTPAEEPLRAYAELLSSDSTVSDAVIAR
jgi:hypothetical protein